jgi:hypothetical protein
MDLRQLAEALRPIALALHIFANVLWRISTLMQPTARCCRTWWRSCAGPEVCPHVASRAWLRCWSVNLGHVQYTPKSGRDSTVCCYLGDCITLFYRRPRRLFPPQLLDAFVYCLWGGRAGRSRGARQARMDVRWLCVCERGRMFLGHPRTLAYQKQKRRG